MRAALVGRVSTEHDSQTTSLERQRAELEEVAHRRGWSVVGWYEDRSSGSKLASRAGLGRALDALYADKADVLVVHDLDRLGRDVREMLATVDALHAVGKGLYVRDQAIDATGPMGRLVFTILSAVGEFYRRDLKQRIKGGLERRRRKGLPMGRTRITDWAQLPRALELRAAGRSWNEIASELKTGSRSSWSNLASKLERRGRCDVVGDPMIWADPPMCVLYRRHGERHLDPTRGWWSGTVSPGSPENGSPNPAPIAASSPSPGKVP